VVPIGLAFPPNHTQKMSAHRSIFIPSIPFVCNKPIIGIIAIVIGILSINAERIAEVHKTISAVNKILSWACTSIKFAKYQRTPADSNHHTNINNDIKNTSTENSSFFKILLGSLSGVTRRISNQAQKIAINAAGR